MNNQKTPIRTARLSGRISAPSNRSHHLSNAIDDVVIPTVSTRLTLADQIGSWKMRWAIGRDDYRVAPGLYKVGAPDRHSEVLVTANYKMTFDRVRQELEGIDAWILVLDTNGINVWCAAGKGTFGTAELIRRVHAVGLEHRVEHRRLILPQLGAVGVAAHEVKQGTGFTVAYGPVRASDIRAYLAAGQVAAPDMRRVRFTTGDRLALAPAELVFAIKPLFIAFGVLFLLNVLGLGAFGFVDAYALIGRSWSGPCWCRSCCRGFPAAPSRSRAPNSACSGCSPLAR